MAWSVTSVRDDHGRGIDGGVFWRKFKGWQWVVVFKLLAGREVGG